MVVVVVVVMVAVVMVVMVMMVDGCVLWPDALEMATSRMPAP